MALDNLKFPATIVSPADLTRARRDLDQYNELQSQADLRAKQGLKSDGVMAGRTIKEMAELCSLDLMQVNDRHELMDLMEQAVTQAPVVTISFAVDPPSVFMGQLVDWLRESIHPLVLVRVGLQPNIAAGCILRTTSKVYDFSMRQKLNKQQPLLVERLRQIRTAELTS